MGSLREILIDLDEALLAIGQNAIWKSRNGDYPVTILGDLGMGFQTVEEAKLLADTEMLKHSEASPR